MAQLDPEVRKPRNSYFLKAAQVAQRRNQYIHYKKSLEGVAQSGTTGSRGEKTSKIYFFGNGASGATAQPIYSLKKSLEGVAQSGTTGPRGEKTSKISFFESDASGATAQPIYLLKSL